MKKTHIILIVLIAVSIGAILTTLGNTSTYASFTEAIDAPDQEFHIVGTRSTEKESDYNPEVDPNIFTFYMLDNNGLEKKVILHKNKPQDFDRSEQIVIIGKMEGVDFHASDILMKCPSKYEDGTPQEMESSAVEESNQ